VHSIVPSSEVHIKHPECTQSLSIAEFVRQNEERIESNIIRESMEQAISQTQSNNTMISPALLEKVHW